MTAPEATLTAKIPSLMKAETSHDSATHPPDNDAAATVDSDSDTDSLLAKLESELDLDTADATEESDPNNTLSSAIASLQAARKSQIQGESHNAFPTGRTIIAPQSLGLQIPSSEQVLIRATADAPAAIVVFYSAAFTSSVRMKDLASGLAREYAAQHTTSTRNGADGAETVFFAAEAEKCEWLCRRLNVKVLPVVVGYVDGKEVGRLIGFEGLKDGENAAWQALAWIVGRWGGGWSGTLSKGSGASILGSRWSEWAGSRDAGRGERKGDSSEESDEDEKASRRKLGFIGGGSGGKRLGIRTNRPRQGIGLDEDDDWE